MNRPQGFSHKRTPPWVQVCPVAPQQWAFPKPHHGRSKSLVSQRLLQKRQVPIGVVRHWHRLGWYLEVPQIQAPWQSMPEKRERRFPTLTVYTWSFMSISESPAHIKRQRRMRLWRFKSHLCLVPAVDFRKVTMILCLLFPCLEGWIIIPAPKTSVIIQREDDKVGIELNAWYVHEHSSLSYHVFWSTIWI